MLPGWNAGFAGMSMNPNRVMSTGRLSRVRPFRNCPITGDVRNVMETRNSSWYSMTGPMADLQQTVIQLEQVFCRIQAERMQDVPILNPALSVQGVGFTDWNGSYLGILLTPWFINIVLLSANNHHCDGRRTGEKCLQRLPSGEYEFLVSEEEGIGKYQACSLMSPVFEFDCQQSAVLFAEQSMRQIMCPQDAGDEVADESTAYPPLQSAPGDYQTVTQRKLTRRDLLRGRWTGGKQ